MHPYLPHKPASNAQGTHNQPYANHFTNSHGYQAAAFPTGYHMYGSPYPPGVTSTPLVNPYAPHINYNILPLQHSVPGPSAGYGRGQPSSNTLQQQFIRPLGLNGAGTTGPCSCTYPGCLFKGTQKSLETHKMDRHLIYPPGWNNRKRKRPEEETDEEAAARLTGVVTVPGTTVVLNTPDTIQAWIAERKKRYPFQKRVEEKEQALKDAIDRGQILPPDKKRRPPRDHNTRGRGGLGRGRGRGGRPPSHRGRLVAVPGREQQSECATRKPGGTPEGRNVLHTVDTETDGISAKIFHDIQTSSGSESGSDLDPAKDAVSSRPPPGYVGEDDEEQSMDMVAAEHVTNGSTGKGGENGEAPSLETSGRPLLPPPRRKAPQPKRQPRAPFNDRPSLLRNLLLSDIRTTVSNLSQAIHFLVANDFLENVELKPGDAANPMIRVLETRPADNGGVDDDPSGQQ